MKNTNVFELIKRNALEVVGGLQEGSVSPTKSLKELGASSLDRMEIITMTLRQLGIRMPMMDLARASNIGDLVDIIVERAEPSEGR